MGHQLNGPLHRDRSYRNWRTGKMAGRDEFKLLAVRSLSDGDGLKLQVAAASAGQGQGDYEQKESEGAQLFHRDLRLHIINLLRGYPRHQLRIEASVAIQFTKSGDYTQNPSRRVNECNCDLTPICPEPLRYAVIPSGKTRETKTRRNGCPRRVWGFCARSRNCWRDCLSFCWQKH